MLLRKGVISCLLVFFTILTANTSAFAGSGKRLNNLVTELVHRGHFTLKSEKEVPFTNPRSGWVYATFDATIPDGGYVEMTNAQGQVLIRKEAGTAGCAETMRWFEQGEQKLILRGQGGASIRSLIIRTMPETHFVRYPQEPRFPQQGSFDWAWLKANVLSSVNTVVGFPDAKINDAIDEWTRQGRKFISYGSLPHDKDLTAAKAFEYWVKNPGFQDARLSGMIADEFQGRQNPLYPAWIEGMRQLGEKMKGSGKAFYGYCGGPGMYSRPEARDIVNTIFNSGFYMAWERYHHEMPSLPEARTFMDTILGQEMAKWQVAFPDCQKHMVVVLGLFATGPDLDVQPDVNYKVWMDMQMQYIATHKLFDGLFGVHWWFSGYSNEDLVRWESALYRHYCIEGQTKLLSEKLGWTYMLNHIKNPDFFYGLIDWTAAPAAPNSMKACYLERYAQIENRYWMKGVYPDDPAGNTYLWTERKANAPNTVSQEIKHLVPGRVYTVQMITSDYQDIIHGRSEKKQHAVSLRIDGAETIPGGSYAAVPVSSPNSHDQLPFKNGPAWFNHHQVMFRATSPTAKLIVSDWASPDAPGGPVGQQFMINYLQLQPYFEGLSH